jgi:hypothetical protein
MAARIDHGRAQLLTRTGLDWTDKYPSVIAARARADRVAGRAKTRMVEALITAPLAFWGIARGQLTGVERIKNEFSGRSPKCALASRPMCNLYSSPSM